MNPLRIAFLLVTTAAWAAKTPIPIAGVSRATPVDFDREVLPFLSDNCLACHCQTTTKGGLNLETRETMLRGGDSGPAIVPKNGSGSLLLQAAAHLDDDLLMPPRDNKAKARNLTPQQLGLLKLWIDQGAIASPKRERAIQWQPPAGNLDAIFAVAVTGDGQFAACSRANRIYIHHLPSGRIVATETAHRDQVNALAFSPDGTLLATGGYREVKLWRRAPVEGRPAQPVAGATGRVARDDARRFVTIDGSVAKLCGADGRLVAELRGNRHAREWIDECDRALQIANGNITYRKDAVQIAEKAMQTAKDRAKKSADTFTARQQELAAKQKALADARAAKSAAEQALATAEAELKKAGAAVQAATTRAVQLATAAADAIGGTAAVDAGKLANEAAAALQAAAKARAGRDHREAQRRLAAGNGEQAIKQLADAEEAAKKAGAARSVVEAELATAKAEEERAAANVRDASAAADAAESSRKKADEALQAAKQAAAAAEQPIRAAAFSPDGSTVVTAGEDQLIHTWSAENGAAFDVMKGHRAAITSLAFAPDGGLVSTASDGSALLWDIKPGWKFERTIGTGDGKSPLADRVSALAFSRDGKWLAIGGGEPSRGGEIKLWEVSDGRIVRDFPKVHSDAVLSLEFSPDGQLLASGAADKMARVIDPATGRVARSFEGHTHHVLGVAWSPDGRTLATAGADNIVKIWDFTTGDRRKNIEGYDKEVTAVRFVAAGTNLLTSSGDSKVRITGLDGNEVRVFPDVADFMQSAAVTADGRIVVAGGQDSVLRVWNADGAAIVAFGPGARKR